MKIALLTFSLLVAAVLPGLAQCGKKIQISASKTHHLDEAGNVSRTMEERSLVQIDGKSVVVNINGEHRATCTIKSMTCNWTVPFKEGKTFIKATTIDNDGEERNVDITVEGSGDQLFLLFQMENTDGGKVKVFIEKFEELG